MNKDVEKMNKRKKVILILAFLVVIVFGIVAFCRAFLVKSRYEIGTFSYSSLVGTSLSMGAYSDTNIFMKDEVILHLNYGFFDKKYYDRYETDPKGPYLHNANDEIIIAMYLSDNSETRVMSGQDILDYKNVENSKLLKEIPIEQAFSGEYSYNKAKGDRINYNHSEEITIPETYFDKQEGEVVINISAYVMPTETRRSYLAMETYSIILEYSNIDGDKIKITNMK